MSKYGDLFDAAWDSAPESGGLVQDGEHTVIIQDARVDINEKGQSIIFEFYYPGATGTYTEKSFQSLNPNNQVGLGITKRNLRVLNPEITASTIDSTLASSIGGKLKLRRKTNGKYINHNFLSFEPKASDPFPDELPF